MFKVSELCQVIDGSTICPYDDFIVKNLTTDSRQVKKGSVFFAFKGDNFDGHDFCELAVKSGASVLVVEKLQLPLPEDVVVIKVKDTLKSYQQLAAYWRLRFKIPVVAVTGSTGKTTTKDIIAAALGDSLKVLKSYANFNNEIGVPATLLRLDSTYQAAVLEMGMRGLGQIKELAEIANPTIGVVTNVGKTHIEILGSVDNIASAKQELVEALDENSTAIFNGDDTMVAQMVQVAKGKTVCFGLDKNNKVRAENIRQNISGMQFTCIDDISEASYEVEVPILGIHNVYNTLCAISVASVLGVDRTKMLEGLKNIELSGMRQHIENIHGMTFIDDTYNASPDSMRAALSLLKSMPGKRKIAILGDMLELGDIAKKEHAKLGEAVSEAGVNLLITIGNKSQHTSAKAAELGVRTWHFEKQTLALDAAMSLFALGDTVLFKGSRGMHIDELLQLIKQRLAKKEGAAADGKDINE